MTRTCRALFVLAVLVLASGCGGGAAVNIAEVDARSKKFEIISTENGSLHEDAPITNGKALYQEQLMQCVFEVQSTDNRHTQKLYYKFNWFDGDEFPLADQPWHFLSLGSMEKKTLVGTAPQPRAVRCQIMLRRPSKDDRER